jgi:hypothetical protein
MSTSFDNLLASILESAAPEKLEKPSALAKFLGIKSSTLISWAHKYPETLPSLTLPGKGSLRIRAVDLAGFLRKVKNGEVE